MSDIDVRLDPPLSVALVIVPNFSLASLALCADGLRVANRESVTPVFDWTVASVDGAPVVSSSGLAIAPHAALAGIAAARVVIVLTAYEPEAACTPPLLAWLRRQDRRGAVIGCVDTAALVLGRAGLLRDESIAVHREVVDPFREALGDADLLDRPWAFHGRRLSSAGGMATLDMVLALIGRAKGVAFARQVATEMNHPGGGSDGGSAAGGHADGPMVTTVEPRLARIVAQMRDNLETPLTVAEICRRARVEASTARRLCQRHLGRSPGAYYTRLRLERAQTLLHYSHLPIAEIAAAVGFADNAAFTHAFRRVYGRAPSDARRRDTGLG